jgi:hypothetical protein
VDLGYSVIPHAYCSWHTGPSLWKGLIVGLFQGICMLYWSNLIVSFYLAVNALHDSIVMWQRQHKNLCLFFSLLSCRAPIIKCDFGEQGRSDSCITPSDTWGEDDEDKGHARSLIYRGGNCPSKGTQCQLSCFLA